MLPKVILCGFGRWGKIWFNTIKKSGYQCVGIVDPKILMTEIEGVTVYNRSTEVQNREYTHVILATPPETHLKLFQYFSQRINPRNILVEKPMGISSSEASKMINCFPGLVFLYDPITHYIKKNMTIIGEPLLYKSTRASMGPTIRSEISVVEDYLIHDISIFIWLFCRKIKIINAFKTNKFVNDSVKNDTVIVVGESNNLIIDMFSSWIYPIKERSTYIIGTRGSFIWKNDELYFDDTHYNFDNISIDRYKLIVGINNKIIIDKKYSTLELQLKHFIEDKKINMNILDIWDTIDDINIKCNFL